MENQFKNAAEYGSSNETKYIKELFPTFAI